MKDEQEKKVVHNARKARTDDFNAEVRTRVAAHLKRLSEDRTAEVLAEELDVSVSTLNHLKLFQAGRVSPYILSQLAKLLNISTDELINGVKDAREVAAPHPRAIEREREVFVREQVAMVHTILTRQDSVRSARDELGKAIMETLDRCTEEIKERIEAKETVYITGSPNQISIAEIVELERDSTEVWVSTSRDLPYLGKGLNISRDFLSTEADGISRGTKYRYFVGGVPSVEQTQARQDFMHLIWEQGRGLGDEAKFRGLFEKNVEIVFSEDPNRPVFSWALHKLSSKTLKNPWLNSRYRSYFHEISFPDSNDSSVGYGTWVGHMCFSPPGEKIFILMHEEMLKRAFLYFDSQMRSRTPTSGRLRATKRTPSKRNSSV